MGLSTKIVEILKNHGSTGMIGIRYYLSAEYETRAGEHYNSDDMAYIMQGLLKDEIIQESNGYYSIV